MSRPHFPFFLLYHPQRIGTGCGAQIIAVHVGVYLGRVQVVVAQDLLQSAHVYAVLKHQSSGSVAQLWAEYWVLSNPEAARCFFTSLCNRSAGGCAGGSDG